MRDMDKTKAQLITELNRLRRRNADLEAREAEYNRVGTALKKSEAKFRLLTEKAVAGVYLVRDGLFTYVNPRMAEIFGYEPHELIHKKGPIDVVFHSDWPVVERNLQKRISGEVEAVNFRFRGIRKDGGVIHVEVYGSRTDDAGRSGIIGTLIDISDRVWTEMDLENELEKFQALYDLAVAMTAERTLDENLLLVVETSRSLLKADKAFIALRDEERNELYMHTLSGIEADEFRDLKIPFGMGLGGKVAETGRLSVVEDYYKETEPHFHDIMR